MTVTLSIASKVCYNPTALRPVGHSRWMLISQGCTLPTLMHKYESVQVCYSIYLLLYSTVVLLTPGFFLTPPAETQGQNSSKKLKKKTQPLGGLSLPFAKLKKKTKFHETFSSKLKIFKGVALFTPFLLTNIFKNRKK